MIKLTHEILKEELEYNPDTGIFTRLIGRGGQVPGDVAGSVDERGYVLVELLGCTYYAHRLAFFYMIGRWPNPQTDHINREKTDNRWCNLREVTANENQFNAKMRTDNTSGHKGVYFFKRTGKWMAAMGVNGKQKHLGFFNTKADAIEARKKAEVLYYGY